MALPPSRGKDRPPAIPSFSIYKRNLLKARVVICSYNQHIGPFSRAFWLVQHHQVYSGVGADIVMESIVLTTWSISAMAILR